jgi:hypothetical protein
LIKQFTVIEISKIQDGGHRPSASLDFSNRDNFLTPRLILSKFGDQLCTHNGYYSQLSNYKKIQDGDRMPAAILHF